MRPFKVTQRQIGLWFQSSGFHPIEGVCVHSWRIYLSVCVGELPCCLGCGFHWTLCSLEGRECDLSDFSLAPCSTWSQGYSCGAGEKSEVSALCVSHRKDSMTHLRTRDCENKKSAVTIELKQSLTWKICEEKLKLPLFQMLHLCYCKIGA